MADINTYYERLIDAVQAAPAGSEDEYYLAQELEALMNEHGERAIRQNVPATHGSSVIRAGLLVFMAVLAIISGLVFRVPKLILYILMIAAVAIIIADALGVGISDRFGQRVKSQNVIFRHPSPNSAREHKRPIVVVAHYDTPRIDPLYSPIFRILLENKRVIVFVCMIVDSIAIPLEVLRFIPDLGHTIMWVLAIVAAIPLLFFGVTGILSGSVLRFTKGANDNMSGVAALLGVLERIRPTQQPDEEKNESEYYAIEQTNVRHGEEELRSLGVLPSTTMIVYTVEETPDEDMTGQLKIVSDDILVDAGLIGDAPDETKKENDFFSDPLADGSFVEDPSAIAFHSIKSENPGNRFADAIEDAPQESEIATQEIPKVAPLDTTEKTIDDPNWGHTTFTPYVPSRSQLLDLPDPGVAAVDPFSVDVSDALHVSPEDSAMFGFTAEDEDPEIAKASSGGPSKPMVSSVPLKTMSSQAPVDKQASENNKKKKHRFFGRKEEEDSFSDWLGLEEDYDAKQGGREIGSWDNFDQKKDDKGWKGGATRGYDFENVSDEEIHSSLTSMGDHDLLDHEIWIVATGASEFDNAGMRHFMKTYTKELRGAFVINVQAVGAGRLSAITEEGAGRTRRADRKLLQMIEDIAADYHFDLEKTTLAWRDTDATHAMYNGCRGVSLMGMDGIVPAHSHQSNDVAHNVDLDQIAQTVDIVTELIRRS